MQFLKIYYHIYTEYSTPCGIALFFLIIESKIHFSIPYHTKNRAEERDFLSSSALFFFIFYNYLLFTPLPALPPAAGSSCSLS